MMNARTVSRGAAALGFLVAGWAGAWLSPALAADVTLSDITVDAGFATYKAPRVDVAGTSLTEAQLRGLLDKNAPSPLADRLSTLSATSITIPELVIQQGKQVVTYKDLVLRNIASGKVQDAASSGATLKTETPQGATTGSFGLTRVTDLDLPFTARLYTEAAKPGETVVKPVYSSFSLDNLAVTTEKNVAVTIASIKASDIKGRLGPRPLLDDVKLIAGTANPDDLSAAERTQFFRSVAAVMDAFEVGSGEATGIKVSDPSDGKTTAASIAKVAYAGTQSGGVTITGIEIAPPDGKLRLGSLAFTGFSLRRTFDALKDLAIRPDLKSDDIDLRRLLPTLGTVSITDFNVDLPNEKVPDERVRFGVKSLSATASQQIEGVPTAFRTQIDHLTFALPPESPDSGVKDLVELGYKNLDLTLALDGVWNEAAQEFQVKDLTVSGIDMGTAKAQATLGNVTKDVFSGDPTVSQVALAGATAKALSLSFDNKGLVERMIAREARKQGMRPDDLKRQFGAMAAMIVPAFLGNSPDARSFGGAMAKFIAKPGRLDVKAKARDPGGLGASDLVGASSNPAEIFSKLNVEASAN